MLNFLWILLSLFLIVIIFLRAPQNSGLASFATKTNLSAEEFGEGSFDKGFYFSVPVKLFYADYKPGLISFGLHPLTKDGGATIIEPHALYGITGDSQSKSILRDWEYITD